MAREGNFDHTFVAGRMHSKSTHLTFDDVLSKYGCSVKCSGHKKWNAQGNGRWHNHFKHVHRLRHADHNLDIDGIPIEMLPTSNMQDYLTLEEFGQYKEMSYCLGEVTRLQTQASIYFEQYQNLLKYFSRDNVPDIPLYIALLLSARLHSNTSSTDVVPHIRRKKCEGSKFEYVCARHGKKGYKYYIVKSGCSSDVVVNGAKLKQYLTLEAEQQQQQDDNTDNDDVDNDNDSADNTESDNEGGDNAA
eukprot:8323-Heterococcus_DN1.PRE.5